LDDGMTAITRRSALRATGLGVAGPGLGCPSARTRAGAPWPGLVLCAFLATGGTLIDASPIDAIQIRPTQIPPAFAVSHPAGICDMTATSSVAHLRDNRQPGRWPQLDAAWCRRIAQAVA
jgi:sirohydrochlorin ferrochelatase